MAGQSVAHARPGGPFRQLPEALAGLNAGQKLGRQGPWRVACMEPPPHCGGELARPSPKPLSQALPKQR